MPDLDFDDDLAADALQFGLNAQGDAAMHQQPHQLEALTITSTGSLVECLQIANEVYGITNSACSEAFYQWAQAALVGDVNKEETEELLVLLRKERESYSGRVAWRCHKKIEKRGTQEVLRLQARRHAVICAMNVVRAVLNSLKGRSYEIWTQRSLWRATKTERDIRSQA